MQCQMVLLQRALRHGGRPHIGRGQVLQNGKLAAPLIHMDAAVGVHLPAGSGALLPGQMGVAVQHLDVIVQFVQLAHLPPRQRAVLTGEQQVGKLHDRLLPQTVALAVAQIVVLVLGGIAQQCYVVALPQHKIQSFNGTALPDMHPQLLAAGCLLQKIHRRIGGVGGMGQHHPQLGAAALLVRLLLQLVHLLQHPLRLPDEPLALLGGDHARGGALKDAQPVFLFQILQRLADVGLRRVQLLCRRRHRPPFHDGYQIPQFRNIHDPLRVVCSRNCIVTISPRRCQAGENKPSQSAPPCTKAPGCYIIRKNTKEGLYHAGIPRAAH